MITDDELLKVYSNTCLQGSPNDAIRFARAVLALAEQKQAAALADLRRWKSTHAPRIEALQGLLETAQREAAAGTEARSTLSSEREANTILTAEIELLRARIAELEAAQPCCGSWSSCTVPCVPRANHWQSEAHRIAELESQAAQPAQVPNRKAAEQAYAETAFDYAKAPIGSRDWCLFWDGFKAASAPKPAQVAAPTQAEHDAAIAQIRRAFEDDDSAKVAAPEGIPSEVEALEFRRDQYGLNCGQWSAVLGMLPSHYSEFLSGKRCLPKSAMGKAFEFGVPAEALFQVRPDKGAADIDRRLRELEKMREGGAA
jgi:antitoxin component HigA of HigAB toxin-antitoxin module